MLGVGLSMGEVAVRAQYASVPGGGSPGTLDPAITAPVLSLAVGPTTYPPEFDAALDDTVAVGDTIRLQWSTDIRFGTITGDATNTIDLAEATANEAAFAGLADITSGTHYFRARVEQPDGDYSAWSDLVLHGEAVDSTPAAFTFTDVNNATLSTVYESNEITLSGFNQPVTISVTGGEYSLNGAAYTSASGTAYPADTVKVRHTSSGSNSTAVNTVLTVGGVSDTYTTTTVAAAVSLPTSGLILRLDADDSSTLFQTITGTTAPVDGQPIGTWQDKSATAFHFTAAANDTTRPTYRAGGGLPYIEFDGTNDVLRRLAKLGLYDAAGATGLTIMIALRTLSATATGSNNAPIAERDSASTSSVFSPLGTSNGTDDILPFLRNSANISITFSGLVLTSGYGGSDSVITYTDNGSQVIGYHDGVAGATRTYTRAGTVTIDTTSIGGWFRDGSASAWLGARIYAMAVWNRILDSSERAQARAYMGSKQGRSL